jgi:hypothetical protein
MCGAVRPARRRQSEQQLTEYQDVQARPTHSLRTVLLRGSYFGHWQSIWTHQDIPAAGSTQVLLFLIRLLRNVTVDIQKYITSAWYF